MKVDLAIILALAPPALGVHSGIEEAAVGVVAQLGDRMQLEVHDLINIFLFGEVVVHALISDGGRQAVAMVVQLLFVEIHARLVLGWGPRGLLLAGGRLGDDEGKGTAAGDIYHGQSRNLQPAVGPTGAAVEEVPQSKGVFAALGNNRGILRRDQLRARIQCSRHYPLMKVGPVKGPAKLARHRALGVLAVATQIAPGDPPSQGQHRG